MLRVVAQRSVITALRTTAVVSSHLSQSRVCTVAKRGVSVYNQSTRALTNANDSLFVSRISTAAHQCSNNYLSHHRYNTVASQLSNVLHNRRLQWLSILSEHAPSILNFSATPRGFGRFQKDKKPSSSSSSPESSSSSSSSSSTSSSTTSTSTSKPAKKKSSKSEKQPKSADKPASTGVKESSASKAFKIFSSGTGGDKGDSNKSSEESGSSEGGASNNPFNNIPSWLLVVPLVLLFFGPNLTYRSNQNQITFQQFKIHMLEAGLVDHIEVVNKTTARVFLNKDLEENSKYSLDDHDKKKRSVYGGFQPGTVYEFNIGSVTAFEEKLEQAQLDIGIDQADWVPVQYVDEISIRDSVLQLITSGPILTLLVFYWIIRMFKKSAGGLFPGGPGAGAGKGGFGSIFDVTKANYKVINKGEKVKTKFSDVAGLDNAKEEVMEFVKFLKDPEQYTKLGARIPKGALLVGPPGTGKTLLARAVAGEAECPFFSISGSDFVEMFVGVGPSRVRNLFQEARKNAPCIVFIDEIDAVGRKRGRGGFAGGNDERENTLNQLLVEMDGFKSDSNIVVLAGTNRHDILDSALMRPGRFDRQVQIEKPDITGRIAIFKVHLKKIKLKQDSHDVAQRMATLTPGYSGADIANVVNEAALRAARKGREAVKIDDFYEANDRVLAGLEKKIVMTQHEKELIAHHEAGHAVAGWFLEHADPLLKVTVIPRASGALGFAQYLPKEIQLYTAAQLYDMIKMSLAGRAAEQIFFGCVSTGAADDLNKVTKLAYNQISVYGMNEKLGNLSFQQEQNQEGIQTFRPYSEKTAELIDNEASTLVKAAYAETLKLLEEKKQLVKELATGLLEKETLGHDQLVEILGQRPFKNDAYMSYLSSTNEFTTKYQDEQADEETDADAKTEAEEKVDEASSTSSESKAKDADDHDESGSDTDMEEPSTK